MTNDEYYYWLANISNIGSRKISLLLEVYESPEDIFKASESELSEALREGPLGRGVRTYVSDARHIINSRNRDRIKRDYDKLVQKGIKFIHIRDPRYPEKLKAIYDPPFALYVKGDLPEDGAKCLAIVGTRDCSGYGAGMAGYLAGVLAREGIGIISGLARGIDTYAHDGALSSGGKTYAVLGCGVDICYPRENFRLYMRIAMEGGIISEYGPGTRPAASNFPMRNRIISGLSDGILVIEAGKKSGALITADMGLDQGKDIYALPGRVTDRLSEGCNNLIKLGAKLVSSPEDILEELLHDYKKADSQGKLSVKGKFAVQGDNTTLCKNNDNMLETHGKIVYACLGFEPVHIGEISAKTGLPLEVCMEQLLLLELNGLIVQTMKNYYALHG